MTKTMKAAVVHDFGKPLTIEDVPVPAPGPGELLVKVVACGVCHTDLHAAEGDWPVKPALPFIPGHEVVGVVAALGPGVSDFKEGDPVGVAWLHDACMRCEYCETGWETLCEHQHNTGYSCNGGFAEYVIASAAFAARLPAGVDFAQMAPILCAGVTTYKGLKETEAHPGEWVVISGIGGLGHVAIQYAKAMGLKVVALDIAADKLALARAAGAEGVIDARSPDAVADVLKATAGGAHGILVTAVSPPAFSQALRMVRRKGTVALVGLPPGEFPTPIFDVVLKRVTVRGSIVGTRRDLDEAIAFAAEGKVKAEITKAPLSDINAIFARLKAGKIDGRVVLDLTGSDRASARKLELAESET
ncbi:MULTISPECIES: alcohol dehydrogenase AdhP [unclassified Mesorhizobium]|uniref:alcohol dehydrogenase AdhP n=1 Tax=unclassified Mesorhizobium TaxID=325217 RepID=UPI000FCCD76A|nr:MULTISPECIES: alcohol dehydrogenase AdhP [unclassified Mesorhizobium]RUW34719.1 alcohol dehydrogenase AdhP [Mesorhizobium sp. M1E.F.Ca.ET.041.01.1.1]RWD81877.1 MAG: alcohol dehydrogenase AdhP [Mesorhizobium sp.]RWD86578.1 MAG: alcohol dehydrogenase AdhP [Mesorhizobium sp.]TIV52706.1 MAG: alcohol dehydrogenase AdhP [Mesorhizobium sp.]